MNNVLRCVYLSFFKDGFVPEIDTKQRHYNWLWKTVMGPNLINLIYEYRALKTLENNLSDFIRRYTLIE